MMRTSNPSIEFDEPWETPKRRNKHSEHVVTQLRAKHRLTQEALAEVWGIGRSLLALVEAGERSLPFTLEEGVRMLEAVAEERARTQAQFAEIIEQYNRGLLCYLIAREGSSLLVITKQADTWVVRRRFDDRALAVTYLALLRRESCPTT